MSTNICPPKIKKYKRIIPSHVLAFMFNLCNWALYLDSLNGFAEHYGLSGHRLSHGDTGDKILFGFICVVSLSLFYCNQTTYPETISKTLPCLNADDSETDEKKMKKHVRALAVTASIYKAIAASTSFVAFAKTRFNITSGWGIGVTWASAVICLFGNAPSQYAIFAIPYEQLDWEIKSSKRKCAVAHLATLLYNIPNAALYFNAVDVFLKNIHALDHRLTEGSEAWELGLVGVIGFFSIVLLLTTQHTYAKKVADIFTKKEENPQSENTTCMSSSLKTLNYIGSGLTAFYKTTGTSLSLIALSYTATNSLTFGISIAAICYIGNLIAQFSIFKPEENRLKDGYEQFDSESRGGCCSRLFSRAATLSSGAPLGLVSAKNSPV